MGQFCDEVSRGLGWAWSACTWLPRRDANGSNQRHVGRSHARLCSDQRISHGKLPGISALYPVENSPLPGAEQGSGPASLSQRLALQEHTFSPGDGGAKAPEISTTWRNSGHGWSTPWSMPPGCESAVHRGATAGILCCANVAMSASRKAAASG